MTHPKSQDDLGPEIENPTVYLSAYIADLSNTLDKAITQEVVHCGITGLEYRILWYCLGEERTATWLSQILLVDGFRITRVVTGLVDGGLLGRRRLRADRRIVMLRLTEEGLELTTQIFQNMQRRYAMFTTGIGEEEIRTFASVASMIIANCKVAQTSNSL